MESLSDEYGSVSEIEELSKRIEQLGRKSTEGFGSVSEIEELSKRIGRLRGNSTENYTAVDSRCISGQPSNLENCTYAFADRSKEKHGNGNTSVFILAGSERITETHEGIKEFHIRKADDKISCPISRLKDAFKRLGHQIHCITSEYESNPKNPNKAEFLRKIVKLKNHVFNLMGTATNLTRTVDSRSLDSQPRIFMNGTISYVKGLQQHHKCKIPLIRDKCEWKPYHKLREHERRVQSHFERAEACSRPRNLNSDFPYGHRFISLMQQNLVDLTHRSISNSRTDILAYPYTSLTLNNQEDLTFPNVSNSRTDLLAYPCKSLILEKQVDGTLPSIPHFIRMKHESNDINCEDKVDKE